jgi:hypothetical protein
MPNRVNDYDPLVPENLIDHPIVSDSKFEQAGQVTCQCLRFNAIEILRKPMYPSYDSARNGWIQLFEFT